MWRAFIMKDNTSLKPSASTEYDDTDEFDGTDTGDDIAIWRKEPISRLTFTLPGGQSRWCVCVFIISAILLLALIISISLTNQKVDRKFSTVDREMSNLTQSLLSLTSRIQQLERNGQEALVRLSQMWMSVYRLQEQARIMSVQMQNAQEAASRLKCIINNLQNNTRDDCCPLEWKLFSSHCYYFSDYGKSWNEARDECESMKAELLILKSKEEKRFVISQTKPNFYWLGLSDERTGEWEWLDRTPYVMVRSEWMPGQPDNWQEHGLGGGEDCAHFHRDGRYNDDHCSRNYRFVCKAHASTINK